MKKIWILAIFFTIIMSLGSFFLFRNSESEIYTFSYDSNETFILGSFFVEDLNIAGNDLSSAPLTTFIFKSTEREDKFKSYVFSLNSFQGETNFLYPNNFNYTFYSFEDKGYQYILYKDKLSRYVLEPMYAVFEYVKGDNSANFRFVSPLYMYFNNTDALSDDHDLSLNEFISFYEGFNTDLVKINQVDNSVEVKAYNIYKEKMSDSYVLRVKYSQETIQVDYLGSTNE